MLSASTTLCTVQRSLTSRRQIIGKREGREGIYWGERGNQVRGERESREGRERESNEIGRRERESKRERERATQNCLPILWYLFCGHSAYIFIFLRIFQKVECAPPPLWNCVFPCTKIFPFRASHSVSGRSLDRQYRINNNNNNNSSNNEHITKKTEFLCEKIHTFMENKLIKN